MLERKIAKLASDIAGTCVSSFQMLQKPGSSARKPRSCRQRVQQQAWSKLDLAHGA